MIDLASFQKTEGISRDVLEARIGILCAEVSSSRAALRELHDALTNVQAVSTRQLRELRVHRALRPVNVVGDNPEGAFLAEAIHELALARAKYPGPEALDILLMVLAEETGETCRAHLHKEGSVKIRQEAAQVVATCVRLAVEGLREGAAP